MTPKSLADAIDRYARANGICAVALDGPQGWRDSATPEGTPGVGRRCEYECRTQAKTGVYPLTFPANQRPWIEFCIDLFAELLEKEGVLLADPSATRCPPPDGYMVLECYPTSAWRSSGLTSLPGKYKKPPLEPYLASLTGAYGLPPSVSRVMSHDDLQAIIAALVAVAAVGGPALAISQGIASSTWVDEQGVRRRLEGFIWNVQPLISSADASQPPEPVRVDSIAAQAVTRGEVRVTQRVVDQVSRVGNHQSQIALRNVPGGTKVAPATIILGVDGEEYTLVVGDTNAAWRSHQNATTRDFFERLFAFLSDRPDAWQPVTHLRVNRSAAPEG